MNNLYIAVHIKDKAMKEPEIITGNRIIADFMGIGYPDGRLHYHSSYDWLIPVLNKLEDLAYRFKIHNNSIKYYYCTIYNKSTNFDGSSAGKQSQLNEAIYRAIVQVIKAEGSIK